MVLNNLNLNYINYKSSYETNWFLYKFILEEIGYSYD